MAWLANLDRRSAHWPAVAHWSYVALKWCLILMGAFAWFMLWYERQPLLGLAQLALIGYGLWTYLHPTEPPPAPALDASDSAETPRSD